jgi:UDP-N-acetylmuramoyl-tripeptide--D-alanyl-D-alanine ligase
VRFQASAVAAAVGGTLHGDDVEVDGVAIDSRLVAPGQLFVPIVAERDGHDFIVAALASGAAAYLTTKAPDDGTAIVVADTSAALIEVGRLARAALPDLVVGITGSVGKTTVKDLTASILGQRFRTAASERSFNNELGVPMTLANAPEDTEAVVVEMGARGRGHVALLCEVARPTIGLVTVVALAHAEMFGTIEEVARAKSELVQSLPAHGTAVLNADDDNVAAMAHRTEASVLTFGVERADADVDADHVTVDDELRASFVLRSPWGTVDVRLAVRGAHQVSNALAAASASLAAGAGLDHVAAGLAAATLSPWRMELARTPDGAIVLNDAYNANPTSMRAALSSLAALPARRRIAVLGVMAELGTEGDSAHVEIVEEARDLGIEVIAVDAPQYGTGVRSVRNVDDALRAIGPVGDGDAILVKGSRVAGLERLASALLAKGANKV